MMVQGHFRVALSVHRSKFASNLLNFENFGLLSSFEAGMWPKSDVFPSKLKIPYFCVAQSTTNGKKKSDSAHRRQQRHRV